MSDTNTTNEQDVVETAEETLEQDSPNAPATGFDQESFTAVKGLIQRLSVQLDEVKNKKKEYQQRLKNIFDNDSQLSEFEEQAKESTLAFKKRKKELEDSLEGKEIKGKIKEHGEEIRDLEESLTNSLISYFQITGIQSFDTPSGEEREFKLKARLMPSKNQ